MRGVLFCIFCIVSVFQSFAQDGLVGVVTDRQSGEPLPFARIHVVETGEKIDTDFRGQYNLKTLYKGQSYTLNYSFAGYALQSYEVVLDSNSRVVKEMDVELQPLQLPSFPSTTASVTHFE